MDPKLRERLERLRAMANDASSEHEAMIAAKRLQALLAKHGLSELELGAEPTYGEDTLKVQRGAWARKICSAVADLYFCKAFHLERTNRMVVVGSDQYRETALTVMRAVLRVVTVEAKHSARTKRPGDTHVNTWIASFRAGAASRIASRCEELKRAAKAGALQDEDGSTLPVLASLYEQELDAVGDYLARSPWNIRTFRDPVRANSRAGKEAGDACGQRVPLGQQLNQHAPRGLPNGGKS